MKKVKKLCIEVETKALISITPSLGVFMTYMFRFILTIFVLLILNGCGNGGGNSTSEPAPVPSPPIVNAGAEQLIFESSTVTLTGEATINTAGSEITSYLWEQISGTPVTLNNVDSITASFTSPKVNIDTLLTFKLTITDNNNNTASDTVSITVQPLQVNVLSVSAGEDQTVFEQSNVILSGSATSNEITSYLWTQISGRHVTLTNADSITASFTSPKVNIDTLLTFQLAVTDNNDNTASDTVTVTVQPSKTSLLTVSAGEDQTVFEQSNVILSGSVTGSVITSYLWAQISGIPVTFTNPDYITASFTSPKVDTAALLTFQLTVTDDNNNTASDTIAISVQTNKPPNDHVLYVAPHGDDNDAGTIESPLQTFEGARNKVRKLIGDNKNITIYFRTGTYTFADTVILGPQDSGSDKQVITYRNYAQEKPIFTSLVKLDNWTTYSGNIMQASLPSGTAQVRYLQDTSETWLKRSSTAFFRPDFVAPCGGAECEHWEPGEPQQRKTYTTYPQSFTFPDVTKASQYDIRTHMTAWNAQVLPITSVVTSSRRINVGTPSHYSLVDGVDDLRSEVWLLNSIEGIDQPGEWASIDGKIYLYPSSGTDDIYAPTLTELIRLDAGGDGNTWQGTPVQNIHFSGITFTGTDYRISIASDVMAQHDWQMVDVDEGLIRLRNVSNISIKNSKFTKAGSDAIRLDRSAQNVIIDNCDFSYLGKGGVLMSGRGPGYGDVNHHNTITNSRFNQTSRIKWDAAAVHIDQSSSNVIKQNFFEDIPLSAIIVSGNRDSNIAEKAANPINRDFHFAEIRPDLIDNWQGSSTEFYDHDNMVEENTFRAVHIGMPELIPAVSLTAPGFTNGMIYTTGRKKGATDTFRKNYFYDVDAQPTLSHTWVILGDGQEDYLDFHQNMVYNLSQTNGFEDPPMMSNNCNLVGGCKANANVKLQSTYSTMECAICENTSYAGNVDLDIGTPAGSATYITEYQEMWSLLCPGVLPAPTSGVLNGASEMQSKLSSKITELGGTVPSC
jgi:hypothetical protein